MAHSIAAASSGDDMALAELFFAHKPMIEKFAVGTWNMGNESDDIAQMVFIRLRESLKFYEHRSDSGFRSFLIELTAQECRKMKRTWKRRVKPASVALDDPDQFKAISQASSATESDLLLRVCIEETLQKLSPLQRTTVSALMEQGAVSGQKQGTASFRVHSAAKQFAKVWDAAPDDVVTYGARKLNDDDVRRIRGYKESGIYTHQEIADIFGVTKSFIGNIVNGRSRKLPSKPLPNISMRHTTSGETKCVTGRACAFPGVFDNECRTHRLDRFATYSVTRPQTGHSWIRATCRHPQWDYKGTLLKFARGRDSKRVRSNRQKLREDDVRRIRKLRRDEGLSAEKIAARFGVGPTCIRDVLKGKKWADVI